MTPYDLHILNETDFKAYARLVYLGRRLENISLEDLRNHSQFTSKQGEKQNVQENRRNKTSAEYWRYPKNEA